MTAVYELFSFSSGQAWKGVHPSPIQGVKEFQGIVVCVQVLLGYLHQASATHVAVDSVWSQRIVEDGLAAKDNCISSQGLQKSAIIGF